MRFRGLTRLTTLMIASFLAVLPQALAANPGDQIVVSVFITDGNLKPIPAVSPDQVVVEDDHKAPANVIAIAHDGSPLRLGVLIDSSNSQGKRQAYKSAVDGLSEFLRGVLRKDGDKVFIESFGTVPEQPTPWMTVDELKSAEFHLQRNGGTSVYDAIDRACRERFADNSTAARRVLVLLTDGEDNMSHVTLEEALAMAQWAKVAIIAISTGRTLERRGTSILKNLTEKTGGYAFLDVNPAEMQQVYSQVGNLLNSMFQLVYVPSQSAEHGQARELKVKPASGKKLLVKAPTRYYTATP